MKALLSFFALLMLTVSQADAALVTSRADLNAILGGGGALVDFESFSVASGGFTVTDCTVIDSSSICSGQGPNLVAPGVRISSADSGTFQWDGSGYFGSPSQEILAYTDTMIAIDFLGAGVTAFGIDLRTFAGYGENADMILYGPGGTQYLDTVSGINISSSGAPVFAGWADSGGIGRVEFHSNINGWSPIIDNLEFGSTAVPVPAAFWLFTSGLFGLIGLARRKKSV